MNGAGNDFIVIDKTKNKTVSFTKTNIINLCNRRKGIGADGVIMLSSSKSSNFLMEYFNSDGSSGSLCGNGARCAIQYASDSDKFKNAKAIFNANDEIFSGEVLKNGLVRFDLKSPTRVKLNFRIKASSQLIKSNFADTGSPHVVIEIEDVLAHPKDLNSRYRNIENFPVSEIGREIRYHKDFLPSGANVNFIQVKNDTLHIRTYERGVENETLACGTGSVAAAIIASVIKNLKSPIKIITKGNDELVVEFQRIGERFEKVALSGPVKTVFSGEFDLKDF